MAFLQVYFDVSGFVKIAFQGQRSWPELNNFSFLLLRLSSPLVTSCSCVQYVKSSVMGFFLSWEYWNKLLQIPGYLIEQNRTKIQSNSIERLVFNWVRHLNKIENLFCCEFDFRTNRTKSNCPLVLVTLNALPLETSFLQMRNSSPTFAV